MGTGTLFLCRIPGTIAARGQGAVAMGSDWRTAVATAEICLWPGGSEGDWPQLVLAAAIRRKYDLKA